MEWLGLQPLARAPVQSLPSEAEVLQMIWGHLNSDFSRFRGMASISCRLVGGKTICLSEDRGSCGGAENACFLFKVKEPYVKAGIPVFDTDTHCLRKLTNLKSCFDKKRRNRNIKLEDKTAYIQKLSSTTLCLLPEDWERRIKAEAFMTGGQNRERVNAVQDYFGIAATRSALIQQESDLVKQARQAWKNRGQEGQSRERGEGLGERGGSVESGRPAWY